MGLVDLRTDLKSIKFGKDTVGGGNSNQPYIVRDIPESFQDVGRTGGPDFLLRGGTLLPRRVINDTSRMVQMLFDDPLIVDQIADGLQDIKPEDYLLLAGDPVLIGIVTAIAADMLDGEINLLKWDRQEKVYLPLHLSLYGAVN